MLHSLRATFLGLAAARCGPMRVEADAALEFVRDAQKCDVKFLDADVKRPLSSVSADIVVCGPQESYIENTFVGQRIPLSRRTGMFVLQLDAQAGSRKTKNVRFDKPKDARFQA